MSPWGNFYVLAHQYYCKGCKKTFQGTDERLMKHLPEFVRLQYPAFIGKKSAIDRKSLPLLARQIVKGQSIKDFREMWLELR